METPKNRTFKRPINRLVIGIGLLLLLLAIVVYVRIRYHGNKLATLITDAVNKSIVGRMEVESLEWPIWSMPKAITGGWVPAIAKGIKVYDEFGELIVESPELRGDIDIHRVLFGDNPDVILRNLVVPKGGTCKVIEKKHPYAKAQYDRHAISLLSAFDGKPKKHFAAGVDGTSGPVFDLQDFKGENLDVEIQFRSFQSQFKGVSTEGMLTFDGQDPIQNRFIFDVTPKAERGRYIQPPLVDVPLQNVQLETLTLLPKGWPSDDIAHDLIYKGVGESGPAKLSVEGTVFEFATDSMGGFHDLNMEATNAGHIAAAMFEDELVRGDDLDFKLHLGGPNAAMTVKMMADDVDVVIPFDNKSPLELHVARGVVGLDFATDSGFIEDTLIEGAGGSALVSGALHSNPSTYDVQAKIIKPFNIRPFITPLTADAIGTKLRGELHIFGNGELARIDNANMRLGQARIRGRGSRTTADKMLHLDQVTMTVGETRFTNIKGRIDTANDGVDIDMSVDSKDATKWLRFFEAPPNLAKRVQGKINLSGMFTVPTIQADVHASGVPFINSIKSNFTFREGESLKLGNTQAEAWGGKLNLAGQIPLTPGKQVSIDSLRAEGSSINLSQVPVVGSFANGRVDFSVKAKGRLDSPSATLNASIKKLNVLGESYKNTDFTINTKPKGLSRLNTRIVRAKGGTIDIAATLNQFKDLGGSIALQDIPISRIVTTTNQNIDAGGNVNALLNLSGTVDAPTADGHIQAHRTWVNDTFLGNADINLSRQSSGTIQIDSNFFQDSLRITGSVKTRFPFVSDLTIELRRLEIDRFIPDIARLAQARAFVTGTIVWQGALLKSRRHSSPKVSATLREIAVIKDGVDDNDRPTPLRISNRSPLELEWRGDKIVLLNDAVFEGPTGDITIAGAVSMDSLDLRAKANIPLKYFSPYTTRYFDELAGSVDVEFVAAGPLLSPQIRGVMQINKISVKPTGQDARVEVPAGRIEFNNQGLSLTGLSLVVANEFSNERSELNVSGGLRMTKGRPSLWAVVIDGTLSGEMLLALTPQYLSSASGNADISIALSGEGEVPNIDGSIAFFDDSPLAITPRGSGTELSFEQGEIRFTDDKVELDGIAGWVDDEGHITNLSGSFDIEDWQPTGIDIQVSATDLPFRIPKTLELLLNVDNVHVVGGANNCPAAKRFSPECYEFGFEGKLEIEDGRYTRYWNPLLENLEPVRVVETTAPLHERYPLIANATLDLELNTQGFGVKNNVADIDMSGRLQILGTVNNPIFDGEIKIDQGNVKIQGIRARFDQTDGNIIFDADKSFPLQTPTMNIRSESNYRDLDGQDHIVKLFIGGTIEEPNFDLSTQAGFNKGQTLVLILLGRTPEAAREVILGDQGIATQAGQIQGATTTADSEGVFQATNEVIKDFAGDFVNEILGRELREFTSLDVASIKIGTASFGFYGEKSWTKSFRLHLEYDQTINGQSFNTGLGYRINDSWSLDGELLRKAFDDPALLDDSQQRIKATWTFTLP